MSSKRTEGNVVEIMDNTQDTRPFSMSTECFDCGFYMYSKEGQSTLVDANVREELGM
jgi:hypothetical protein